MTKRRRAIRNTDNEGKSAQDTARRALKGQPETADDDPAALDENTLAGTRITSQENARVTIETDEGVVEELEAMDENTLAENKSTIEAEQGVATDRPLDVVGTMPGQPLGPLVEGEVEKRELASDDPAALDKATLAANKSTMRAESVVKDYELEDKKDKVAGRDASLDQWQSDAARKIVRTSDVVGTMPGQPLRPLVEEEVEITSPKTEGAVSSGLDLTDGIGSKEPDGPVFDPRTGSVDEAETLVAPSTEVKDSHDRYANVEVSTPREVYLTEEEQARVHLAEQSREDEQRRDLDLAAELSKALEEESSRDTSVVLDEGHVDPDLAVPHEPGEVLLDSDWNEQLETED